VTLIGAETNYWRKETTS